MMEETDIEADVARLREKWFGGDAKPLPALDAEEEAVAAKWLGKSEAARLARTRTGERFRYRPAVVVAHYGYIPPAESVHAAFPLGDYWYVEVFKQGRKYELMRGTREECLGAVARLERMRISITRVGSERSDEELAGVSLSTPSRRQQPSQRKAILEQIGNLRR